uniref:NADH dehydrogenase subunit 4L n=1 Tax=Pseudosymplanella nigrifasciata TaxID=2886261 RepID=UPI001E766271|nr:NADH dehydrogenase subunit 4L [Pseudosymplanella nigrifasciata]UDL72067.1 NADH dehydrogenase subunit 4L [Pseudosymplanella nigrifasciata]
MFILLIIFFSGLIGLFIVRKFFLLSLLMIEFMSISLFGLCSYYFMYFLYSNFFSIVFLVFTVCDGVLGLSLMVYLVRSDSFDYLMSMSLC